MYYFTCLANSNALRGQTLLSDGQLTLKYDMPDTRQLHRRYIARFISYKLQLPSCTMFNSTLHTNLG